MRKSAALARLEEMRLLLPSDCRIVVKSVATIVESIVTLGPGRFQSAGAKS
jgi:hypothetical protein